MPRSAAGSAGNRLRAAASLATEMKGGLTVASRIVRETAFGTTPADRGQLRWGARREPVILLHGLGADSSSFSTLERRLHREGYTVYSVNYSCFGADIAACGSHLELEAAWVRDETGSESASVVAHSLGGVVLRWAMTHTWMRDWIDVAVTLGSPHLGTPTARLAPVGLPGFGKIISQLRPGVADDNLGALDPCMHAATRWVAVAAQYDWVVPTRYARLPDAENVRNVTVPGGGHLALANSDHSHHVILEELAASERRKHDSSAA